MWNTFFMQIYDFLITFTEYTVDREIIRRYS